MMEWKGILIGFGICLLWIVSLIVLVIPAYQVAQNAEDEAHDFWKDRYVDKIHDERYHAFYMGCVEGIYPNEDLIKIDGDVEWNFIFCSKAATDFVEEKENI